MILSFLHGERDSEVTVTFIVDQRHNLRGEISTICIVNLLHLIEMAYFHRHHWLLAGLDWIVYKFGPFAFGIPLTLKEPCLPRAVNSWTGCLYRAKPLAIPPGRELTMVEAILYKPNYLVLAKRGAVRRGSVYEERMRLSAFEAQAEPLDDMTEGTEIEVAS